MASPSFWTTWRRLLGLPGMMTRTWLEHMVLLNMSPAKPSGGCGNTLSTKLVGLSD